MKEASPVLLPLLRSRTQGDIIAWILLHPEEEFSLTEIGRAVGASGPTGHARGRPSGGGRVGP